MQDCHVELGKIKVVIKELMNKAEKLLSKKKKKKS